MGEDPKKNSVRWITPTASERNITWHQWGQHQIWPNGIIFHQPRFPWNFRGFPLQFATIWGPKNSCFRPRWNLTRSNGYGYTPIPGVKAATSPKLWCSTPKAPKLNKFCMGVFVGIYLGDFNQPIWKKNMRKYKLEKNPQIGINIQKNIYIYIIFETTT